jgi:hypothetical protein
MTRAICVSVIATAALLGACDDNDNDNDDIIGGTGETLEWRANVAGIGDFANISGSADVTFATGAFQFGATTSIVGDEPGAVRAWHVSNGSCVTGGDIVGLDSDYLPLVADSAGKNTVSVIVPEALDPNGVFHVDFRGGTSGADFDTVIACGDLIPQF